jgi:alkanesulfonate monooxygenase SsuD/methylene tetrahydromethanopterin reductase-like flavin-dependent oxidoreductase (luciferase family)
MERIGLGLFSYLIGHTPYKELVELSRLAEEKGFEAVVFPELVNDALACAEAVALGTHRIKVGTCIANIWLRHPILTAATAVTIDELSEGRMILGLGVSHRPLMETLGVTMEAPRQYLREYVGRVRQAWTGHLPGLPTQPRPAKHPIPIYLAAVSLQAAELGGEIADGLMLVFAVRERLARVRQAVTRGAEKAGRNPQTIDIAMGFPTFLSDDIGAARQAARTCLTFYAVLPFYNRLLRNSGFVAEAEGVRQAMARGDQQGAAACISDRMLDALLPVGPAERCRETIAAFSAAGIALPIVMPYPIAEDYSRAVRRALDAFAPR